MADSSDILNAVVTKLGADATLLALCPNGVYADEGPPGATRLVIVSLADAEDVQMFGGRAIEDELVHVEAQMLSTVAGANIKAAAARIEVLLENQPLTVAGYTHMAMFRESPIREAERDDADASILWYRRGGRYRVMVST